LLEKAAKKQGVNVSDILNKEGKRIDMRSENYYPSIQVSKPNEIRSTNAAFDPRFKDSDLILSANAPKQSTFGKISNALAAPQRYTMKKMAEMLGVKGDANNSEASAQAIVEKAAALTGLQDSAGLNAAKALGVAGLEVFADPTNLIPVGKVAKGLGMLAHTAPVKSAVSALSHTAPAKAAFSALSDATDKLRKVYQKNPAKFEKLAEKNPALKPIIAKLKATGSGAIDSRNATGGAIAEIRPDMGYGPVGVANDIGQTKGLGKVTVQVPENPKNLGKVTVPANSTVKQKNFGKTIVKQEKDGNIIIVDEKGNVLKKIPKGTTIGSR